MRKKWTKKEEEQLKKLATSQTTAEIARKLGRTYHQVYARMQKLGIKPYKKEKVDPVEAYKKAALEKYDKKFVEKLLKEKSDRDIILDLLQEIVPRVEFRPLNLTPKVSRVNKEKFVLVLNDIHIGKYSRELLRKKAEYLISSTLEILKIQRAGAEIKELVIFAIGDFVDGDGIYPTQAYEQKFHLMEQMLSGYPIIGDMINGLSNHFDEVTIHCVKGNHGRVSKYTDTKLNFDTIFYHLVKLYTANNPKLKWNISDDWYMIAKVSRFGFFLTHGDFIRAWMNLPFYGIKEKGMRWQGLTKQEIVKFQNEWVQIEREYWNYLIMGHFHTSLYFKWNDWRCIINGTWRDDDSFAESALGLDCATEQTVFGVHEKRGITWKREISLRKEELN